MAPTRCGRKKNCGASHNCESCGQKFCKCEHVNPVVELVKQHLQLIAQALVEVCIACGIHDAKAKCAFELIRAYFQSYECSRHSVTHKSEIPLQKQHIMHELQNKCLMTSLESELTYVIIKRAFKTYFHQAPIGGIANPMRELLRIHAQEKLWTHAATRSIHIFRDDYEFVFTDAPKNYDVIIRKIYRDLYARLKQCTDIEQVPSCECQDCCIKRSVVGRLRAKRLKNCPGIRTPPNELNINAAAMEEEDNLLPLRSLQQLPVICDDVFKIKRKVAPTFEQQMAHLREHPSDMSVNIPRCYKCSRSKEICVCNLNFYSGMLKAQCSLEPFTVQWMLMPDDECLDPCDPVNHQCPVDCTNLSPTSENDDKEVCEGRNLADLDYDSELDGYCMCQTKEYVVDDDDEKASSLDEFGRVSNHGLSKQSSFDCKTKLIRSSEDRIETSREAFFCRYKCS